MIAGHREKTRALVIVGDSGIAEVACEYFRHDSAYDVAAFAVDRAFLTRDRLCDRPVIAFEDVEAQFPPASHDLFVAVGFAKMNRLRARLYAEAKHKGYALASYVSSKAFVWPNVTIGDNAFIFEHNVIQPFVRIGDDVTLWSGNHIGHHSVIGDHCFVASHVVISGFVRIGAYCFFGVNSTVAHNVTIGASNLIGAGALILKDIGDGGIYGEEATAARPVTTFDRFGIEPE